MGKFSILDQKGSPPRLHIGMRMIKTSIAVFICGMIGWLRGESTLFSMVAAVLCMQPSREKTLTTAANRTLGTFIGGLFGVVALYISALCGFNDIKPLYYLFISLVLLPVILLSVQLRMRDIAALSCIVFISITVNHRSDGQFWLDAVQRTLDTLIGIGVALVINLILPQHRFPDNEVITSAQEAETVPDAESGGDDTASGKDDIPEK